MIGQVCQVLSIDFPQLHGLVARRFGDGDANGIANLERRRSIDHLGFHDRNKRIRVTGTVTLDDSGARFISENVAAPLLRRLSTWSQRGAVAGF